MKTLLMLGKLEDWNELPYHHPSYQLYFILYDTAFTFSSFKEEKHKFDMASSGILSRNDLHTV